MSYTKHILHCFSMIIIIVCFLSVVLKAQSHHIEAELRYSFWLRTFLITIKFLVLLGLPAVLCSFLGLLLYNTFPEKVALKSSPLLAPFISFRVVTRGDFPSLVIENVMNHVDLCFAVGIKDFVIEVVTDKPINLPKHRQIRQIVVPRDYRTKSGAMFKSRALQYCLEDDVNILNPHDWIVHLDEETVITENAVRGIVNFVADGNYSFGQGLISYANGCVVNWILTLSESFRASIDLGVTRFLLKAFHMPVFGWKGSFFVSQVIQLEMSEAF
jgi:beta-1,4-mannosyltransferase